jgi:hypothetical protein
MKYAIVGSLLLLPVLSWVQAAAPERGPAAHRGAGIFLRVEIGGNAGEKQLLLRNSLLDAVVLTTRWRNLEPEKGQFNLEPLKTEAADWARAGKGVVLCVLPYGQTPDKAQELAGGAHPVSETPSWLYREPNCSVISFTGGGGAQGTRVALPAVWKDGFAETYLEPQVAVLGRAFDGDPRIWYVKVSFGHIGHLTAQPSPDGSRAFLEAGWTPENWGDYCRRVVAIYQKHFRKTPLLLTAEKLLIRERGPNTYRETEVKLLEEFAQQGVTIIHVGIEDPAATERIYAQISGAIPLAKKGTIRLGMGDDWPLWVPPSRRRQPITRGHDEEYLRNRLRYAFGGLDGYPELPTTILYLQPPEVLVADPHNKRKGELGHQPEIQRILAGAREHLQQNDRAMYSR